MKTHTVLGLFCHGGTKSKQWVWHRLQHLEVQSANYPTCNIPLKVCRIQNVNQVLDRHLTRPGEPEEGEGARTVRTRKYTCQFDTENN
jgi:hypothetical protein